MTEDRRLTGFRVPRFVDLDGPEAAARIQRLVTHLGSRPRVDPMERWNQAAKLERLREEGFSDEDRAELLAWAERHAPPSR